MQQYTLGHNKSDSCKLHFSMEDQNFDYNAKNLELTAPLHSLRGH